MVSIDFSKAFDSVNRKTMRPCMVSPRKLSQPSRECTRIHRPFFDTADGPRDIFSTTTGILQGDTLAPYLLVIVVHCILCQSVDNMSCRGLFLTPTRSTRHPSKYITDLDYADDIVLTSDNLKNAISLLHSLERAANRVDLHMNCSKTEYILVKDCEHEEVKSLNENILKQVDDFKYLGSYTPSSKIDFEIKKAQVWVPCNKLHTIWTSGISTKTKINLFKTCVESIFLYGSETWTMSKQLEKHLDGTYRRLLMRVQSINWKQYFTLEQIYGNLPKASDVVRMRRNRFAGHCVRAKEEIISDLLFWSLPHRKRGRKPLSYMEHL